MDRRDLLVVPHRHPAEDAPSGMGAGFRAVARILLRRPWARVLLAMLALDVIFIIIEGLVQATDYGFPGAFRLSLQTEGGVPELYGYAKSGVVAAMLLAAARRWRLAPAAAWGAIYLYLTFDDALRIHERLGARIAETVGGGLGGRPPQDAGEMTVYAVVGVISLTALLWAERRHPSPAPSRLTRLLLPLTALMALFGVAADMALSAIPGEAALEDGGELVILTFIAATTFVYARRGPDLAAEL